MGDPFDPPRGDVGLFDEAIRTMEESIKSLRQLAINTGCFIHGVSQQHQARKELISEHFKKCRIEPGDFLRFKKAIPIDSQNPCGEILLEAETIDVIYLGMVDTTYVERDGKIKPYHAGTVHFFFLDRPFGVCDVDPTWWLSEILSRAKDSLE